MQPNKIWFRFTAFIRGCQIVLLLSSGAWLGGFLIGPDRIPGTLREYYAIEANEYYHSPAWQEDCAKYAYWDNKPHWRFSWCGRSDSASLADLIRRDVEDELEKRHKWVTRNKVQRPSSVSFWMSLVFLALGLYFRRNPCEFDDLILSLPILRDYYRPLFRRYTVTAVDEKGEELGREVLDTLGKAKKAGLKLDRPGALVSIEPEFIELDCYQQILRERGVRA